MSLCNQTLQKIKHNGCLTSTEAQDMAQELLNLRSRTTTPSAAPPAPPVLDLSKPVQTRDGRPVTIITTKGRGTYPLVGYAGEENTELRSWRSDGIFFSGAIRPLDLVNVEEKIELTRWANMYKRNGQVVLSIMHRTREIADSFSGTDALIPRFACIEVKISATEGEGL